MTLTAAIADRIALILPRLASNHDGEVVASVRAIERIIKGAGGDWHDIAKTFTRGAAPVVVDEKPSQPQPSQHKSRSAPSWDSLSIADRIEWLSMCAEKAHLSPWEHEFVASILSKHRDNPYRVFTPKQKTVCERIIRSAFNFGYRP